jgi:aspartate/methionine/tyrosine aminotransferase
MARVPLDHLHWSKTVAPRHAWNLADSAIASPDLAALGMPDEARLPREGYAAQDRLERGLGARMRAPGDRVVLSTGASEANAALFGALLSPGDEVLIESPGYQPLRRVPEVFGARVRTFAWPAAPGTLGTAVERALSPATRMVVISDLHNPSGARLDDADVAGLAALAQARGVHVLCDETFRDAAERPAGTTAGAGSTWIATGSLTKVYGLGSLRVGWIAGLPAALEAGEAGVNAFTVQPSLLSIDLALRLLPHLDRLLARTRGILAANRETWARFVERHAPFRGAPSFGTTAWCTFGADGEGDAFAEFAGARFDLAIPRGSWFGDGRGVRISLAAEPPRFAATLEILSAAARTFEWSEATIQEPV